MAAPDVPSVKRAGLPVDLERQAADGDAWLTPEDRYALKTYGVCAQELRRRLEPLGLSVRTVRRRGWVLEAAESA